MAEDWLEIMKHAVRQSSQGQVAKELGVSKAMVSLVLHGKYKADTAQIQTKIKKIYGSGGVVRCPVMGSISPEKCADTHEKAKKIGFRAGNPETLRFYKQCRECEIRRRK